MLPKVIRSVNKFDTEGPLSHILGFREGELPMKYLGVPLISSRLKVVYCKGLVDRLTSKVRHWTCRTLSYAGQVQLINSVLFSI